MGEQQTATGAQTSKCPHPEAVGKRWGDSISPERKRELNKILDTWNSPGVEHSVRKGPFVGVDLTGADVFWLAERSGASKVRGVPNLHLEGAWLTRAHLEGAELRGGHLEGAHLWGAHLEGANLGGGHLEGANLFGGAHLEGADISWTHLEGADLRMAPLQGIRFWEVHLEGADLSAAHLEGADLRSCWLDSKTVFRGTTIDRATALGDIHWSGVGVVNLTYVAWENVPTMGDERGVGLRSPSAEHASTVRAYRQVAAQLRTQGMTDVADRFAYRSQTRQRWAHLSSPLHNWRRPWRWPGDLARYFGSLFLAVLAGYGYRPGRTLFWYLVTVGSFMCGYWLVTHGVPLFGLTEPSGTQPLHWYEALVLSVASFHGRGFFPSGISLGDPVAILAACEAVIGLFIEISFIATFTQRYFGAK